MSRHTSTHLALLSALIVAGFAANGGFAADRARDGDASPLVFDQVEQALAVGFYPRPFLVDFLFQVTGDAPVAIRNFSTSCPCTTVMLDRTDYFPGQKGVISAHYEYRAGETLEVQIVEVRTNRSRRPQLLRIVPLRSAVALWTDRTELRWQDASVGRSQSCDIEVAPELGGAVPRIATSTAGWNATIVPTEVGGRFRLTVAPAVEHPPQADLIVRLPAAMADGGLDPVSALVVKLVPAANGR